MKKALLSVVAAGLVATAVAPAALAVDTTVGYNTNTNTPADGSIFKELRQGFDVERESARLAANTPEGQVAVLEYTDLEGQVRRVEVKGTKKVKAAAQTPAKPAVKALPKTSAVK